MRKMFLIAFALAAFFGGCDSEDSNEAKRYERQAALDKGDWQKVLSLTENCGGDQACRNDRAAAYVVKAGLSASKIITAIEDENDKSYFAQLGKLFKADADVSLQSAMDEYALTIGNQALVCKSGSSANKWQKDACFNRSLAAISQSAVIIVNVLDNYSCWSSTCSSIDNADVDTLVNLIFVETDTLIKLLGIDSDTREEIEKIKSDINASNSCYDTDSCKTAILSYINANK